MSIFKARTITYTENNLIFELYLIGHKNLGESIVFFVKSHYKCLYSGVVDCYSTDRVAVVEKLLQDNNITELSFLCWTHPHDDHSLGIINIFDNFCTQNTSIWIPDVSSIEPDAYSKESAEFYKKLFSKFKIKKTSFLWDINTVSDNKNLVSVHFNNLNIIHNFTIDSFSPPSRCIIYDRTKNKIRNINYYSIGLIINIGIYYILLGGDVQNEILRNIPQFDINGIEYLKIPHHGSDTSDFIINKFTQDIHPVIATTTVFRSKNLPNKVILEKYKEWGVQSLICTGHINKRNDTDDYGYIKTTFDLLKTSGTIEIPVEYGGNAEEFI